MVLAPIIDHDNFMNIRLLGKIHLSLPEGLQDFINAVVGGDHQRHQRPHGSSAFRQPMSYACRLKPGEMTFRSKATRSPAPAKDLPLSKITSELEMKTVNPAIP